MMAVSLSYNPSCWILFQTFIKHYMKYTFFILAIFLGACTSNTKVEEPTYVPVNLPKESQPAKAGYYCPMKCEGVKVYDDDQNPCPVCKMKLVHTK